MEHAIRNFAFDDQLVRVVMRGEDPRFVAADICRILHLRDASEAVEKLDDDEKHLHEGLNTPDSVRGNPNRYIVSESGLYTIILRSRAATTPGSPAHRFRKWVTAEVLPQIRKTGRYEAPQGETIPPASLQEDRIKLDKIHYCLRIHGPPAARALWLALGLDWVPEMEAAAAAPLTTDMAVARFAEARLMKRPGVVTAAGVIYGAYRDWCGENATVPLGESAFGKALSKLGFDKVKSNRIYYRNIVLKPAEAQQDA